MDKVTIVGVVSDSNSATGIAKEAKPLLYKSLANVIAYPLLISSSGIDNMVETIVNVSPTFSLIHLENIPSPACFEIMEKLQLQLDIPVFHDDIHGTSMVVLAGLMNALKIQNRDPQGMRVVINGAGTAGLSIAHILHAYGFTDIIAVDSQGILHQDRHDINAYKREFLRMIGIKRAPGTLSDALRGADIFIGASIGNVLKLELLKVMNEKPIIFALANPVPEILPTSLDHFDGIIATGRSTFSNQINNAVGYPGFVKGILTAQIKRIETNHIIQAAYAIATTVSDDELRRDCIIPDISHPHLVQNIVNRMITLL